MAHHHGHSLSDVHLPPLGRRLRTVMFVVLGVVGAATIIGMTALWPDYAKVAAVAEQVAATNHLPDGTTFERGEIVGELEDCTIPASEAALSDPAGIAGRTATACTLMDVRLETGADAGHTVEVLAQGPFARSGLQPGDHIELTAIPGYSSPEGTTYELASEYGISGIFRGGPLILLALVFVAVVVWVGRLRGALALVALVISAGVLVAFMLPALIVGEPGILVGLVGSSAIMFVILYFVHGPNMKTTAALIGTLCGIGIIATVSIIAIRITRLNGVDEEGSALLVAMTAEIDFRALLTCAIIVASLGILNDVTITQASSVWELRAAAPHLSRREVFASAMRIGRDHIASTVYTVFFAYTGAALSVLMVMLLNNRPLLSLLTAETLTAEIVHTLCGGIGLTLAVPITTGVAAMFLPPARDSLTAHAGPAR